MIRLLPESVKKIPRPESQTNSYALALLVTTWLILVANAPAAVDLVI